jgi:branched-chain amino acid transport system permease protein
MVVLGGMASTFGAILGAVLLTLLPELLVVFEDYEVLIFGAILMLIMIFWPQGIAGGLRDLWQSRRSLLGREGGVGQDAA